MVEYFIIEYIMNKYIVRFDISWLNILN